MPGNFQHSFFMQHFQKQGFLLKLPGLCAGFAEAARLYFLMGRDKFYRFKKMIQYLAYSDPDELCNELQYVKKIKDTSDIAKLVLEIPEFFDTVAIFAQPYLYTRILGQQVSQPKVSMITSYVEAKKYRYFQYQLGGTKKLYSFPIILTQGDSISRLYWKWLHDVASIAATPPACRVCFCLDSFDHRIMLGYDGELDQWQLCDINQMQRLGASIKKENVSKEVFHALKENHSDKSIGFDTAIYCTGKDFPRFKASIFHLHQYLNQFFKEYLSFLMERKTCSNVTLAHLAAKFGYSELLKVMIDLNCDRLNVKTSGGILPLDVAIEHKHENVVNLISQCHLQNHVVNQMPPRRF